MSESVPSSLESGGSAGSTLCSMSGWPFFASSMRPYPAHITPMNSFNPGGGVPFGMVGEGLRGEGFHHVTVSSTVTTPSIIITSRSAVIDLVTK